MPVQGIPRKSQDMTYWARSIGAARSSDVPAAESAVKELTTLVAEREKRSRKEGYGVSTEKASDLSEAEAWLAFAKGKPDEALAELRAAADRQDKNGGESVGVPAREMLADMFLELKRPADALAEYRASLKLSPNRFDSLYGAARAAQTFYAQLASVCPAGADRPELAETRSYLASKGN